MIDSGPATPAIVCKNHPNRATVLRCGKCELGICPSCIVQTPVGARCRECAQLRRLPQFEVGGWPFIRAALAGLVVSLVGWYLAFFVPFFTFFAAIFVGLAVGEVMSRLANRRSNRALEIIAVIAIALGLAGALVFRSQVDLHTLAVLATSPGVVVYLLFPAIIAGFAAVIKLR